MRRRRGGAIATVALLALLVVGLTASSGSRIAAAEDGQGPAAARSATSQYHRAEVAQREGYALPPAGPLHECISAADGSAGSMGLHWINSDLVRDAVLDVDHPEVLVYEPTRNGRLRLVALEYVVFADAWQAAHPGTTPTLFGKPLKYVAEPNRYELPAFYEIHAWVWKHNPHGMFADHNPRASCRFAR